jgi:hypothetical protein
MQMSAWQRQDMLLIANQSDFITSQAIRKKPVQICFLYSNILEKVPKKYAKSAEVNLPLLY